MVAVVNPEVDNVEIGLHSRPSVITGPCTIGVEPFGLDRVIPEVAGLTQPRHSQQHPHRAGLRLVAVSDLATWPALLPIELQLHSTVLSQSRGLRGFVR